MIAVAWKARDLRRKSLLRHEAAVAVEPPPVLRAHQCRTARCAEHERIPRVRACIGERAQRVIVPAALDEQWTVEHGDRNPRAARSGLLVERTRVIAALG